MPKFRKKPVVIEAIQWDGEHIDAMIDFMKSGSPWPKPPDDINITTGVGYTPITGELDIPTLEGTMKALVGDWIIKGIKGEFYPCKPDIFEATYERID